MTVETLDLDRPRIHASSTSAGVRWSAPAIAGYTTQPQLHQSQRYETTLPGSAFAGARRDLNALSALQYDWDTYGGRAPTTMALSIARSVLGYVELCFRFAARDRVVPYFIGPLPTGGITLEWRSPKGQLGIDIEPTGGIGYILVEDSPTGRRFQEKALAPWTEVSSLLMRILAPQ